MKISLVFFAILLLVCPFSWADNDAAPQEAAAEDAASNGEPSKGDSEVTEEAVALSQKHNEEGLALLKEQMSEEAIEAFKKAIEANPGNKEAFKNLGISYSWVGRHDEAVETFLKLVDAAPDYDAAYRNLVLLYNMEGSYKKAITYAEKALELNPEDYSVMGYLINDYISTGEYGKAAEYGKKLAEHNPDNYRPHRLLAMAYCGMGEMEEAEKEFKKSYDMVRATSKYADAPEKRRSMKSLFSEMRAEVLFLDGNRYIENADQDRSIEAYKESIKLNPADFRPYYNLAKIYEAIKEKKLAVDNIRKAIHVNPYLFKQIMASGEFEALRDTEEFKQMAAELEAAQKKEEQKE